MSTRNIRKLLGGNILPPPDEDDTYEPLYAKPSQNNEENKYQGLCHQSESESEPEPDAVKSDEESEKESVKITPRQRRKNKKRNRKLKKQAKKFEEDEIEKSVREINKLLGAPPPAPVVIPEPRRDLQDVLFGVSHKHLNPAAELCRLLGPDLEEAKKRRARNQNYVRRGLIVRLNEEELSRFRRVGISMSMSPKTDDGLNYFKIDHDTDYQQHVKLFLKMALSNREDFPEINPLVVVDNCRAEEMLQLVDIYFAMEEYSKAKKILEVLVAYLQFISHPLFRLTDRKNRLEYRVLENRLYHVTMLKYAYLMTNSACHRTALEITKVLMNLDPSDPLALIILVDMLALRAREHQWLIDLVDYWKIHRDADFMFNLLYSSALAHFHVIRKQKGDISIADDCLQYAMKRFPNVVLHLLKVTNNKNQVIENCSMFQETIQMPRVFQELWHDLLRFYTMFTASKWREPEVWAWFLRNALDMVEKYHNDAAVRHYVDEFAVQRASMRCLPRQIIRHFQVIKFMNNFIFDEQVTGMRAGVASYNPEPFPTETINRYGYRFSRNQIPQAVRRTNLLGDFVRSMAPEFNAQNNAAAAEDVDAANQPAAPRPDQPAAPRPDQPPPRNGPRGPQGDQAEMAHIVNAICIFVLSGGRLEDVVIESHEPTAERATENVPSNAPNNGEQSNENGAEQNHASGFPNGTIPGPSDEFREPEHGD